MPYASQSSLSLSQEVPCPAYGEGGHEEGEPEDYGAQLVTLVYVTVIFRSPVLIVKYFRCKLSCC